MPLPLALAQRLQKRGILQKKNDEQKRNESEPLEEVIAEDYDDNRLDPKTRLVVKGCPNKYNIYHDCTAFCQKRWSDVSERPSPKTKRKYQKLVKKYPLPEEWQEVYDPGVKCFYYWNMRSDEVSWLPPLHPNSRISMSADKLRTLLRDDEEQGDEETDASDDSYDDSDSGSDSSDTDRRPVDHKKAKDFGRQQRAKGRTIQKSNDLDPMDPSSYSDIPRGKWSDGLGKNDDPKTGVDSTASGPLFQARPYPSPGAVLRMNSQKRPKDDTDSD